MTTFRLEDIKIGGIACAVPDNRVDTVSFYEKFGKEYVDNFIDMTGVKSTYRTAEEQTASDLCFVAARNLIETKGIAKDSIGALVFISQTPDYKAPATACVLHKRLGLPQNCMAFDVNLGCSGFVYGLNIVGSLIKTSNIEKALLLFGDTNTKTLSPEDKSFFMLFGESGSATLLLRESGKTIRGSLMTDGEGFKIMIIPSGAYRNRHGVFERTVWSRDGVIRSDYDAYMDGTDTFSFSVTQVPKIIKRFMETDGKTVDDYDALVLHQANLYMLKQIARKTKFPMEKVPISLDRYGNTSGTSIPLTLCDTYGVDKSGGGVNLLMSGFGVGLSWGVVSAVIEKSNILPLIFTDEYYTEGGVNHD